MKNLDKKTIVKIAIIFVSLLAVAGCAIYFFLPDDIMGMKVYVEPDPDKFSEDELAVLVQRYDANRAKNSEYRGELFFESGLINLPFVQANNNDKYLKVDWESGGQNDLGSLFMDYECDLDSYNIIIYGHNVASSYSGGGESNASKMFSPLASLTNRENYDTNKTLFLVLENEVREYQIVSVFYVPIYGSGEGAYVDANLYYFMPSYDDEYFAKYKEEIKSVEFYDTGVDYTNYDKLLTLQTCVENRDDLRLIVLAKQVDTYVFSRAVSE